MKTLRELIRATPYKQTFNYIYSLYYRDKNYSVDDIMKADTAYLRVCGEMPELPDNPQDKLSIYVTKVPDDEGDVVDVCLYDENEDELFAMDFVPWSDLVDMPVVKACEMADTECLAYILWEMTFWGFDQEKIKQEADRLSKSKYEPPEDISFD